MDGARVAAQLVLAAGLAFVWPGPALVELATRPGASLGPQVTVQFTGLPAATTPEDAGTWFRRIKPACNAVEARSRLAAAPPPAGNDGTAHAAACLALAGHMEDARARIMSLEPEERWRAAGVVFNVGHPAADAGDEVAAGPLMELVVEFWPNQYMALYHAGAARYQRGDRPGATDYLERFLEHYPHQDGWRSSAVAMLRDP